jgi:tetratricopeptide (TPR) repeat protein
MSVRLCFACFTFVLNILIEMIKKLPLYIVLGIAAILISGLTGCNAHKAKILTKAEIDSIGRIRDPDVRITVLDKSIASEPGNAALYHLRSKAYEDSGNLDKALADAKASIEKDSANADYYFYMADLFMLKPSVKNAIGTVERLTMSQPKNKMAYVKLAELYIEMGKKNEKGYYEESLQNLDKALKLDPNLPEAYFWLGYNYREANNTDKAIASFRKAVALKPDYEDAYVILGLLCQEKKDPKAEEYFTTAIRLNPNDTAALYARGKFNQDRDSFQLAINDYQKMLELDPNMRKANYAIGYCLYSLKKYDDALGYFSKVLLNNPKDAAAHDGRSLCYKAKGEFEKARKEKAIADSLWGKP